MRVFIDPLLHLIVALVFPPLLIGIIAKTKAAFGGRVGPPMLQLYWDLFKLLRKGVVISRTTTWVFLAGPVVAFATAIVALLLIPLGGSSSLISFTGDVILLAYLLGLGRFFTAIAALDTGSSFEGMGAARDVTFACLAEPAFFFGLLVVAKLSGSLQLSGMLGGVLFPHWATAGASLGLVLLSWFLVLLVENCRVPFDDPNTHLELTMIHEVMVLDHSGPAWGLIQYSASLKLFVFSALLARVALPTTEIVWLNWVLFLSGVALVAVLVGIVESTMARLKLSHIPTLLVAACLLSGFGLILVAR
jgi:formate hydrogenlyase subunit 4